MLGVTFFNILLFIFSMCTLIDCEGFEKKPKEMIKNTPRNIRGVVSYKRAFNDLNDTQLNIAQAIGVPAIANRAEADKMKKKLTHIVSNDYYIVDSLTHSVPYLIPGAAQLVEDIGKNFLDSLSSKGLNPNKIIITSVLRTEDDVKRLRRSNANASMNSAHCHGTTFDVSWKRFEMVEEKDGHPYESVKSEMLKQVLSEVLRDLKAANRCYVKYELKQGCFHITSRK